MPIVKRMLGGYRDYLTAARDTLMALFGPLVLEAVLKAVALSRMAFERARSASRREVSGMAEAILCLAGFVRGDDGRVFGPGTIGDPNRIKPTAPGEVLK